MDTQLNIQRTPNPNALKFVLDIPVKSEGNYTYTSTAECGDNPLAKALFELNASIREIYFFDNYITVTQDGSADWDALVESLQSAILENIKTHNPDFQTPQTRQSTPVATPSGPELDQINAILNETIRPALQMDGGDVQVVDYADKQLQVFYQGACGSCPSATMGTLAAIQRILRDQFDPEITVSLAAPF